MQYLLSYIIFLLFSSNFIEELLEMHFKEDNSDIIFSIFDSFFITIVKLYEVSKKILFIIGEKSSL